MIITNDLNLPQVFVDAVSSNYRYQPKRYSATSLLKGLKEVILVRRHDHEITTDASKLIWAVFGTAIHDFLEKRQELDTELKEEKIVVPVGDYTLSGKFDLYNAEQKMVTDYKTTSAWTIIHKSFDDWIRQGLIYAVMLEHIGFDVNKFQVIAMLKDHKESEKLRNSDYPVSPVSNLIFDITDEDKKITWEWIQDRFKLIAEYESLPDDNIPCCEPDERWSNGNTYAVMKEGRRSALRVLESDSLAWDWIKDNVKEGDLSNVTVVERPGLDRKCTGYCFANTFCDYWRSTYGKNKESM